MKRRRFLTISAAAPALLTPACERTKALRKSKPEAYTWQGMALGAVASISFDNILADEAKGVIYRLRSEISRLESLFSLYDDSSLISLLNTRGKTIATDHEFKELLYTSLDFSRRSEGLFDPTVQAYSQALQLGYAYNTAPSAPEREAALALVNYRDIAINGLEIRFKKPKMAITLDGIAQGFITDKIHTLLKEAGYSKILINIGEYRALGYQSEAKPWRIQPSQAEQLTFPSRDAIELSDGEALALSSGNSQIFSPDTLEHHLIHPHSGTCRNPNRTVAVKAQDATTADALSTICAITSPEKGAAIVERFPGASILHDSMVS